MNHICPNNLPFWQSVTKQQQTNEYMREVINHHVVREWMEYKSHHHIYESRTFSKKPTWCKLMITLIRRLLVKSSHELIIGHSPQTLTTRIVRKLYLRNPKHIRNKLRCDRNARTSNADRKSVV